MTFRSMTLGGLVAFLVAATMLFSGLGTPPLMQPDEGRNAEVAREMAASGSWLVPTLEGHPYLDKPAAYFATVALSMKVVGRNEWGARLPSALCGFAIVTMLFVFARRVYDDTTAAIAAVAVATAPLFIAFSRIVIMDILLALCVTAAILAPFVAEEGDRPRRGWHALGAVACGCGVLVKGPVGALVPAAVLVTFFLWDGRPRALRRVFAPGNFAIVLALVVPWFAGLVHAHPEFARYGLVEESFNRFFTPAFNRGQPFWFFGPVFLATLMPWTILFVPMAVAAIRTRSRWTPADRLLVSWTVVVLVFFSLSRTKQPGYILTGVIAAAVLVARGCGYAWRNRRGRAGAIVARASAVLSAAALAGGVWLAWKAGHRPLPAPAAAPSDKDWLWTVWPQLLGASAAISVCAALAASGRRVALAIVAFATLQVALFTAALPGVKAYAERRSAKALAEAVAVLPPTTEVAAFESYPAGLSFYLGRTITLVGDDAEPLRSNFIAYWLKTTGAHPPTIVPKSAKEAWLAHDGGDALVVVPGDRHAALEAWLGAGAAVRSLANGWSGAVVARGGVR